MQEILVELVVLGDIVYTLYSIVRVFKPVQKNKCGCSSVACRKFDSS